MPRYLTAIIIVMLLIAVAAVIVWDNVTAISDELSIEKISVSGISKIHSDSSLSGRTLYFSTNANVPRKFGKVYGGADIFDLVGLSGIKGKSKEGFGIVPSRDEWNLAMAEFRGDSDTIDVKYLTEKSGSWLNTSVNDNGDLVACTVFNKQDQDVRLIDVQKMTSIDVETSDSISRWPSVSNDGKKILFHSYMKQSPKGNLFLAEQNENTDWTFSQISSDSEIEFLWPRMSSDGNYLVVVERDLAAMSGKLALYRIEGSSLILEKYLTDETQAERFPSINHNGIFICWQENISSEEKKVSSVIIYNRLTDYKETLTPDDFEGVGDYSFRQPTVSNDGEWVAFVLNSPDYGEDKIGLYNIASGDLYSVSGCGGNFMFPVLTNKINSKNE